LIEGLGGRSLPLLLQRFPVPGQQLGDAPGRVILQTCEHVGEPGLRIDVVELGGLDQRVDRGGSGISWAISVFLLCSCQSSSDGAG